MTRTRTMWGLSFALILGAFALFWTLGTAQAGEQLPQPLTEPEPTVAAHEDCYAGDLEAMAGAMETTDHGGFHASGQHMDGEHGDVHSADQWGSHGNGGHMDGIDSMHGQTGSRRASGWWM